MRDIESGTETPLIPEIEDYLPIHVYTSGLMGLRASLESQPRNQ